MKENSERVLLGIVTVPATQAKWIKFVTGDGKVYAQPPARGRKKKEEVKV